MLKSKYRWVLIVVFLIAAVVALGYLGDSTATHSAGCGCGSH